MLPAPTPTFEYLFRDPRVCFLEPHGKTLGAVISIKRDLGLHQGSSHSGIEMKRGQGAPGGKPSQQASEDGGLTQVQVTGTEEVDERKSE